MIVFESDYKSNDNKNTVLALGNFDGVHTGHCQLLNKAKDYARKNGLSFGVYTFIDSPKYRHPDHSLLTDLQGRLSALHDAVDPDFVYLEKFDDVKELSPFSFVDYIISKFDVSVCFCGENYCFGKGASGDSQTLVALMKSRGRDAVVVPTVLHENTPVSSTRIRSLLSDGDVRTARELLGRPYGFTSKVIHGARIGHSLGFPTINQLVPNVLSVPKYGVYATLVIVDGREYFGVTNFGIKPTVSSDNSPVAETYIIEFDDDVYDKFVGLYFYERLRDEKAFSSLDELRDNIAYNVEQTRKIFEEKHE